MMMSAALEAVDVERSSAAQHRAQQLGRGAQHKFVMASSGDATTAPPRNEGLLTPQEEEQFLAKLGTEALRSAERMGLLGTGVRQAGAAGETPEERELQRRLDMAQLFVETYELNRADALITSILERCREIGGTFKIKAIQALAFVRWKQGRRAR